MPKCANTIALVLLMLAGLISSPGTGQDRKTSPQEAESRQQNDAFKIKVAVDLVTTDVSVIGIPTSRLQPEDFIVFDNNVTQPVAHFSQDQLPLAIALLIDASESIRPYAPVLQIAGISALRRLRPDDRIALYSFSGNVSKLNDITDDRFLIAEKIAKIQIAWGTNLFGAVYEAAQNLAKKAPQRRRAIILVSDNCHVAQSYTADNCRVELLETATTLYNIRTPGDNFGSGNMCALSDLEVKKLVQATGGEVLDVQSPAALQSALEKAITNLRMQYTIGFNPSSPGENGSFHRLAVKLAAPDRCPGCRLVSRSGYYAGVSPSLPHQEEVRTNPRRSQEKEDRLLMERSIMTAGTIDIDLPGIPFKVTTAEQADAGSQPQVKVDLQISPSGIVFKKDGEGRRSCRVRVAIFYVADSGKILGSDWRAVEGQLSEEAYDRVLKTAIPFTTVVPVKQKNQKIKIVVYDEASDAIGSKLVRVN